MEEKPSFFASLFKILKRVALVDSLLLVVVGLYFLFEGKGGMNGFGRLVISTGQIVSGLGILYVLGKNKYPRSAQFLYQFRNTNQNNPQDYGKKNYYSEQKLKPPELFFLFLVGISTIFVGLTIQALW